MSHRFRAWLVAAALSLVWLPKTTAEPSSAAADLIAALDQVHAWRGQFRQLVHDARGFTLDESRGLVEFARPQRLRWETVDPFPQLVMSDGTHVWFYDPDLEQATRRLLSDDVLDVPGLLLAGDARQLLEDFRVEAATEGSLRPFVLSPREVTGATFVRLAIEFEGTELRTLHLLDSLENETRVELNGIAMNPERVDDARFTFQVPEGVTLLEE